MARKEKTNAIGLERSDAKSERPVEKYGDIDHQLKKVRLSGMRAHAEKIIVDTISTQIKKLKENADVYKSVHGETGYNNLLVSLISKMTGGEQQKTAGERLHLFLHYLVVSRCLMMMMTKTNRGDE